MIIHKKNVNKTNNYSKNIRTVFGQGYITIINLIKILFSSLL
jgi:hypothetical protein